PETLSKLQQEAAPLMHRLQAEGIDLRRLDVMLNQDQAGGQAGGQGGRGQGGRAATDSTARRPYSSPEVSGTFGKKSC
ncbi:MAG: hypothetical protein U9Q74_12205, partial [Gemmatimonadota bacterium]|nr:hypothetical protein [Gemmatimonadota bacterium]